MDNENPRTAFEPNKANEVMNALAKTRDGKNTRLNCWGTEITCDHVRRVILQAV